MVAVMLVDFIFFLVRVVEGSLNAIYAILTTLTSEHSFNAGNYKVCTTTGKAATLIRGSTLYSHKDGFGQPIGRTSYSPFSGKSLADQQEKCKEMKLLIVD
eukprot:5761933-Ditylum_brightwellii.AAC.1